MPKFLATFFLIEVKIIHFVEIDSKNFSIPNGGLIQAAQFAICQNGKTIRVDVAVLTQIVLHDFDVG
jgi:hypothetical protein